MANIVYTAELLYDDEGGGWIPGGVFDSPEKARSACGTFEQRQPQSRDLSWYAGHRGPQGSTGTLHAEGGSDRSYEIYEWEVK